MAERPRQFSIEHLLQISVVTAILMSLQTVVGPISAGCLVCYFGLLRLRLVSVALFFSLDGFRASQPQHWLACLQPWFDLSWIIARLGAV